MNGARLLLIELVGRISRRADEWGADWLAEQLHELWLAMGARWDREVFAVVLEARQMREEG